MLDIYEDTGTKSFVGRLNPLLIISVKILIELFDSRKLKSRTFGVKNKKDYMITKIIQEEKIQKAKKYVEKGESFVIVTHVSPDGDALGSSLWFISFPIRLR